MFIWGKKTLLWLFNCCCWYSRHKRILTVTGVPVLPSTPENTHTHTHMKTHGLDNLLPASPVMKIQEGFMDWSVWTRKPVKSLVLFLQFVSRLWKPGNSMEGFCMVRTDGLSWGQMGNPPWEKFFLSYLPQTGLPVAWRIGTIQDKYGKTLWYFNFTQR